MNHAWAMWLDGPMNSWASRRSGCLIAAASGFLFLGSAVAQEADLVRIEGGPDASNHNYSWTVTNLHTAAIVDLEFPNYHTDTWTVPEGWSTEGTTNLVGYGNSEEPGICKASIKAPGRGIPPNGSAQFGLRVMPKGASSGTGTVRIRFDDGRTAEVVGIAVPVSAPVLPRYARLAGMVALFGLFLLWRWSQTRRERSAAESATDQPG